MYSIVLYGISGADQAYRVLRYDIIPVEGNILDTIQYEAGRMVDGYPSVKRVYAVTNSYSIRKDYNEAKRKNSIESWAIFKDILEQSWKVIDNLQD